MKLCVEIQLNFMANFESEHKKKVFQETGDGTNWFSCNVLLTCVWNMSVLSPKDTPVDPKISLYFSQAGTSKFLEST